MSCAVCAAKVYRERKTASVCVDCGKPADADRVRCRKCLVKRAEKMRQRRAA